MMAGSTNHTEVVSSVRLHGATMKNNDLMSGANGDGQHIHMYKHVPSSTESLGMSSAMTTPDISIDSAKYSNLNCEETLPIGGKNAHIYNGLDTENEQADTTVVHFQELKNNDFLESSYINRQFLDDSFELEGNTVKSVIRIDDLIESYIASLKESRSSLTNELHSTIEEFKFDIITDHLSVPIDYSNINKHDTIKDDESENTEIQIKLTDTIYYQLLHSSLPELKSFATMCYLRRNFRKLKKSVILELLTFSIETLNMINNSNVAIKLYSNMIISRTNKLVQLITKLEKHFFYISINRNKKYNSGSYINSNFISNVLHLLISVFVKRIGQLLEYVSDIGSLWKYIAVYGLNKDLEEIKIIQNIIKNPSNCPCNWLNENTRLIKSLQYLKKMVLCIIMSCMEVNSNEYTDEDSSRTLLFMKSFWSKFGYDNLKFSKTQLKFSTRLLGIASNLREIIKFIISLNCEIYEHNMRSNHSLGDDSLNEDLGGLGVLNEYNEDDRITELSKINERISYKLNLIELGLNPNGNELSDLKTDINLLVSKYNDVLTSGKSLPSAANNNSVEKKGYMTSNNKYSETGLKRLRMSEILFDEFESSNHDEDSAIRRSSTGLNIKLFSIVKGESEKEEEEEEINTKNVLADSEFKDKLERIHKTDIANPYSHKNATKTILANSNKKHPNAIDDDKFEEFKNELKLRLLKESLK